MSALGLRFAPFALLGLALLPSAALADVQLQVLAEPQNLRMEDRLTVQVTVKSSGSGSPRIDMPEFEGFEVLSQQVQRPMQFSFSFGARARVESSTIYTFVLQPLREGRLTIKPVRAELDGDVKTSPPIAIAVATGSGSVPTPGAAPADPSQPQAPVSAAPGASVIDQAQVDPIAFLRTVVDKPEPYEGEQVTLTIYLYVRERLSSSPNIETEPTTDGLWVHDLLPPSRTLQPGRQRVADAVYTVYTLRRVAAFPLHTGEVTIGPMAVEIDTSTVFDIFGQNRARPDVKRSSAPIKLKVKPLPEQDKPKGEIAVGHYTIAAKLDRAQAATGDAVTLTATVQGSGNIRTIALVPPQIAGVDVLAPETKDLVSSDDDLVGGTREFRFLLVPKKPGHYQIPPFVLATLDPATGRYERLTSPPLALDAVGQEVASAIPQNAAQDSTAPDQPEPTLDIGGDKHVWAEIRTQSDLERGYTRLADRPLFRWALLLPGLLWIGAVGAGAARKRLSARAAQGPQRAQREADLRLSQAEAAAKAGDASRFHAESAAALLAVLEARLSEPLSGYTRRELHDRLEARGLPSELLRDLVAGLERAEFARFGAHGAGGDLASEAGQLRALYMRLAAFAPPGKEAAA